MAYLKEKHKKCREILREQLFDENNQSLACNIYRKLTENSGFSDNSLGENLNSLLCIFELGWFQNFQPRNNTSNEFYFTTIIFWLYLFHERFEETFSSIYNREVCLQKMKFMPTINEEIRIWANFIKHPKNYLYCHFSYFFFEDEKIEIPAYVEKVDFKKIQVHYNSFKSERPLQFENSYNKCIILPDLENLISGFCKDFKVFIDLLLEDKKSIEILTLKTCENFDY